MSIMLQAENVVYDYPAPDGKEVRALNNVNLSVNKGEFVGIIGRNGSGKSTLAKLFNGLIMPTGGKVIVKGMDTTDGNKIWDIRQTAGMVFQNPDNQIVATVVEEDVAFGPENLGINPQLIRKRVDESLTTVDMYDFLEKAPHLLSGGQKQRIAIAGVLAMRPECIILDEPTAMLDPSGRKEVINTVRKLNKDEGITVVYITHYMDEVVYADRLIALDRGDKIMEGPPLDIFKEVDKLKKIGLDVPQMTELAHNLNKKGLNISRNIMTVDEMVMRLCQL